MKFKVGDRVVKYDSNLKPSKGTVVKIYEDGCLSLDIGAEEIRLFAHPKQCRLLIKKPRRRVWIYKSAFNELTKCREFECLSGHPMVFTSRDDSGENKTGGFGLDMFEFVEVKKPMEPK